MHVPAQPAIERRLLSPLMSIEAVRQGIGFEPGQIQAILIAFRTLSLVCRNIRRLGEADIATGSGRLTKIVWLKRSVML